MSVENFTQNVKRYGLQKQIAHGSVHGKTYNSCYWDVKKKLGHLFELSLASLAPCVRKVCFLCDRHPFHMGLLIQCFFDSRSAPLS